MNEVKNIVVFGSTKEEIHLGCKSLVNGLDKLLIDKYGNDINIQHISHRYLSPFFNKKLYSCESQKSFLNLKTKSTKIVEKRDYKTWKEAYLSMLQNDIFLNLTIKNSDLIIINVEGTIHHKSLLGHQMLAIGKMASDLDKKVFWVNFSVQDEDESILLSALKNATKISAREVNSFNYLSSLGLTVEQSFDTAICANYEINKFNTKLDLGKACLFTGSNVKKYDLVEIANQITLLGLTPIYLPLGLNDYNDLQLIKKNNINYFDYLEISPKQIVNIISQVEMVVSGRHHLNVFCIIASKPFVALESNTWKIKGVCDMINYKVDFDLNISEYIKSIYDNREELSNQLTEFYKPLYQLAQNNI